MKDFVFLSIFNYFWFVAPFAIGIGSAIRLLFGYTANALLSWFVLTISSISISLLIVHFYFGGIGYVAGLMLYPTLLAIILWVFTVVGTKTISIFIEAILSVIIVLILYVTKGYWVLWP